MLIEHKMFEQASCSSVISDRGSSVLVALELGGGGRNAASISGADSAKFQGDNVVCTLDEIDIS